MLIESHSVVSDSLQPHRLQPFRLLGPWNSPGQNTGVAYPFSRGSSRPRNWTQVSCIAGWCFTIWATREVWSQFQEANFKRSAVLTLSKVQKHLKDIPLHKLLKQCQSKPTWESPHVAQYNLHQKGLLKRSPAEGLGKKKSSFSPCWDVDGYRKYG